MTVNPYSQQPRIDPTKKRIYRSGYTRFLDGVIFLIRFIVIRILYPPVRPLLFFLLKVVLAAFSKTMWGAIWEDVKWVVRWFVFSFPPLAWIFIRRAGRWSWWVSVQIRQYLWFFWFQPRPAAKLGLIWLVRGPFRIPFELFLWLCSIPVRLLNSAVWYFRIFRSFPIRSILTILLPIGVCLILFFLYRTVYPDYQLFPIYSSPRWEGSSSVFFWELGLICTVFIPALFLVSTGTTADLLPNRRRPIGSQFGFLLSRKGLTGFHGVYRSAPLLYSFYALLALSALFWAVPFLLSLLLWIKPLGLAHDPWPLHPYFQDKSIWVPFAFMSIFYLAELTPPRGYRLEYNKFNSYFTRWNATEAFTVVDLQLQRYFYMEYTWYDARKKKIPFTKRFKYFMAVPKDWYKRDRIWGVADYFPYGIFSAIQTRDFTNYYKRYVELYYINPSKRRRSIRKRHRYRVRTVLIFPRNKYLYRSPDNEKEFLVEQNRRMLHEEYMEDTIERVKGDWDDDWEEVKKASDEQLDKAWDAHDQLEYPWVANHNAYYDYSAKWGGRGRTAMFPRYINKFRFFGEKEKLST